MTPLVDTCNWIEWLTDGPLAGQFGGHLLDPSAVLVPTLVQCELHRWVCRERDEATALEVLGVTEQGLAVPLGTSPALLASRLAIAHGLALTDAAVYVTARQAGGELVTCDAHLSSLPGVTYYPKN